MKSKERTVFSKNYVDSFFREYEKVFVEFTKRDGSSRTMTCTTDYDMIPEKDYPSGTNAPTFEQAQENKRVYELLPDGGGQWRSFRYDSVTMIAKVEVDW